MKRAIFCFPEKTVTATCLDFDRPQLHIEQDVFFDETQTARNRIVSREWQSLGLSIDLGSITVDEIRLLNDWFARQTPIRICLETEFDTQSKIDRFELLDTVAVTAKWSGIQVQFKNLKFSQEEIQK